MRDLPPGLTHPYDATVAKAETYRHGRTFTWTIGDAYVAIQHGRVVNSSRVTLIRDAHPGEEPTLGRVEVADWVPAPRSYDQWRQPDTMRQIADAWLASQLATTRTAR